jgi:hypothetical protein
MSNNSSIGSAGYTTQNQLIMDRLMTFYKENNYARLTKMLGIINGSSQISLRIIDWFVTNYAKKYFTVYDITRSNGNTARFKVYCNYKLQLRSYSRRRFDPFCRWDRITVPYINDQCFQTTIGQLNFFKWAIENKVIDYIDANYEHIERDMKERNQPKKQKGSPDSAAGPAAESHPEADTARKPRKKREELSISAMKSVKKEHVEIVVKFN